VAVVLAMAFVSALWWVYFGGDDEAGAAALAIALEDQRVDASAWAFAGAHIVHVAGLVLVAAGLEEVIVAPTHELGVRIAVTMAAGCATFLGAQALYLRLLRIPGSAPLFAGAVLALAVAVIGPAVNAVTELGVLVVILICTVTVRMALRDRSEPSTAEGGA
jgi:low temperature requirement protein LtrA